MASSNTNNNDEGTASATTSNIADANTANNSDPAAAAVAMVEQRTVQVHPLPLDWTQMGGTLSPPNRATTAVVRYPSDVAELVPEETEICIVGTAGQKITALGENFSSALSHPEQLTRLILRSHVIRTMEGLQHLTHLELLELYDNQVEALSCLNQGVNGAPGITLRILDMSYNVIRDMEPVAFCPNLQELCKSRLLSFVVGVRVSHPPASMH